MPKPLNSFLQRCYALTDSDEIRQFYDRTAQQYESTLVDDIGYVAPAVSARLFAEFVPDRRARIVDLGCGTGLAGAALGDLGYRHIDGADYAPGMLAVAAEKDCYERLFRVDLNKPLDIATGCYSAALCVGALSSAHIRLEAIDEMVRIIAPGGVFCAAVNERGWFDHGFKDRFDQLAAQDRLEPLRISREDYHVKENIPGWVCLYRVPADKP
jgi:predicted TPR repeat methyltransferase